MSLLIWMRWFEGSFFYMAINMFFHKCILNNERVLCFSQECGDACVTSISCTFSKYMRHYNI